MGGYPKNPSSDMQVHTMVQQVLSYKWKDNIVGAIWIEVFVPSDLLPLYPETKTEHIKQKTQPIHNTQMYNLFPYERAGNLALPEVVYALKSNFLGHILQSELLLSFVKGIMSMHAIAKSQLLLVFPPPWGPGLSAGPGGEGEGMGLARGRDR